MEKDKIIYELKHYHLDFIKHLKSLPSEKITLSVMGKWSAAQQLDHIIKSVSPVSLAFSIPNFILKITFGKSNRPSKTYDELVKKYHGKLAAGGKATNRFVPKSNNDIAQQSAKLKSVVDSLCKKVEGYSEKELDLLLFPHPLLGKLTLREMLYFTIYHVQHHQRQFENNLSVK